MTCSQARPPFRGRGKTEVHLRWLFLLISLGERALIALIKLPSLITQFHLMTKVL